MVPFATPLFYGHEELPFTYRNAVTVQRNIFAGRRHFLSQTFSLLDQVLSRNAVLNEMLCWNKSSSTGELIISQYCKGRNFRKEFNFVAFVLKIEKSTKLNSIPNFLPCSAAANA